MKSIFVALEGVDGVGKSTQVRALETHLSTGGHEVVVVREPGGTPLGEELRRLLLAETDLDMTAESEALLFLASRVQLVEDVIRPTLDRGGSVIADRFHVSTLVYQGVAGALGLERASELVSTVLGDRRPQLNIVLDLPLEQCLARVGDEEDRFEGRPDFLRKVHRAFADPPALVGDRLVRVSAEGDAATVASRVAKEVDRVRS